MPEALNVEREEGTQSTREREEKLEHKRERREVKACNIYFKAAVKIFLVITNGVDAKLGSPNLNYLLMI